MRLELSLKGLCSIISAPFSGGVTFQVHNGKITEVQLCPGPENECTEDMIFQRIEDVWGPTARYGSICN